MGYHLMLSADGGNRTPDRRVTKPLLYQLSYISKLKPVEPKVRRVISRPSSVHLIPFICLNKSLLIVDSHQLSPPGKGGVLVY